MVKITLDIEGMACGMCEAHVNDAVRRVFPVKRSHLHTARERRKSLRKRRSTKTA